MTRPNYDKFCETFKSKDGNVLITPKTSFIAFTRVCDTKLTKCIDICPWTAEKDLGVWIDVFPLDAVSNDRSIFLKIYVL